LLLYISLRIHSFAPVVLFLKVLLNQKKLDVPFQGGLGSYKLYVLVAAHIEKHLALGGVDRPGEILLSFLYRYGSGWVQTKKQRRLDGSPDPETVTLLQQYVSVYSKGPSSSICTPPRDDDVSVADLSNVYRIDAIITLFRTSWERLVQQTQRIQTTTNTLASTNGTELSKKSKCLSILDTVIDSSLLQKSRQSCLDYKEFQHQVNNNFDHEKKGHNHNSYQHQSYQHQRKVVTTRNPKHFKRSRTF
jgi:hypothetical protein